MDEVKEAGISLTPTEQRIMAVLYDGREHAWEELVPCLADADGGDKSNVKVHINALRKKLGPLGQEIVVVTKGAGRNAYRLMLPYRARQPVSSNRG